MALYVQIRTTWELLKLTDPWPRKIRSESLGWGPHIKRFYKISGDSHLGLRNTWPTRLISDLYFLIQDYLKLSPLTRYVPFPITSEDVFEISQSSFRPMYFLHLLLVCLPKTVLLWGGSFCRSQNMGLGAMMRWIQIYFASNQLWDFA